MKGIIAGLTLLSVVSLAQAQGSSTPAAPMATPSPANQSDGPTRATGTGAGSAQGDSSTKLHAADRKFFKEAANAGLAEVAAGNAAAQQSSNQQVKDFAQTMVTDHTKVNNELQQLAQEKAVTLPTAPDAKDQKELDSLTKKQGPAFDKAYVKQQVKAHKQAVSLFKKASKSHDPDIQAFAQKNLPTLQHHLEMAEQLEKGA